MSFNDNDFNDVNNANNNGNMNGMNNMNNMNNGFNNMSGVQNASYDQPNYSDFGDSDDVSAQNNFMSNPMVKKLIIAIAVIVAIILLILLFSVLFKNKKLDLDIPDVVYQDYNVEFVTSVANKTNDLFYEFTSSNEDVLQFEYRNLSAGDSSNTLIPRSVGKSMVNVVASKNGKKVGTYSSEVIVCGVFDSSAFGNDTSKVGVGDKLSLTMDLGTEDACYKRIKYSSSNDDVATVSNEGEVSALKAGNVDITVDNGYKTITKKITVVSTGNVNDVTGVKLNTTSLTVQVGKYAFLYATVSPSSATNKSVIWTSSNDSVAMVSNKGQVVGVSTGTAVITATTQDGNKTAMAKVTVKKAPRGSSSGGSSTGGSSGSKYRKVTKVNISGADFALMVGKTKTLTYAISPKNATNKKITWKSSNPAVAKVSTSGKVTAVGPGTTTISAVSADGVSGKVKVTVTTGKIVKATGLSLSPSSLSINVGQSKKITATVTPKNATIKTIKWVSLNSKIAKVSSAGSVTGVRAGTTTITAVTTDGAVQKSLKVTVKGSTKGDGKKDNNKNVKVTDLLLSQSSIALKKGSSTTVTATVVPSNATNKSVTWRSSNSSVATVSNGKITGVSVGSANILVSVGDITEIINVTVNESSGISCALNLTNNAGQDVSNYIKICTSNLTIKAICNATGGTKVKSITIDTNTDSITKNKITSSGIGTSTKASKTGVIANTTGKNNGTHVITVKASNTAGVPVQIIKSITITGTGTTCPSNKPNISSVWTENYSTSNETGFYVYATVGSGIPTTVELHITNKTSKKSYTKTMKFSSINDNGRYKYYYKFDSVAKNTYNWYVTAKNSYGSDKSKDYDKVGPSSKSSSSSSNRASSSSSSGSSSSSSKGNSGSSSSSSKKSCTKWTLLNTRYVTDCKNDNDGNAKIECSSQTYKKINTYTGTCAMKYYKFSGGSVYVCRGCGSKNTASVKKWADVCTKSNVGKYSYTKREKVNGKYNYYGVRCNELCAKYGDYKYTASYAMYCTAKGTKGKDATYTTCASGKYVMKRTYACARST